MPSVTGVLALLLFAIYLVVMVLTIGRIADAIASSRGVTEYLGRRLWRVVAFLTFPFGLALVLIGWLAARCRVSPGRVAAVLSWGGRLLLLALAAGCLYNAVSLLGPSLLGRAVITAYIVSMPLIFRGADLMARRLGQREADSRTWLRAVLAVTWLAGLAVVAYLEVCHRRNIRRAGWMDALTLSALVAAVVVGVGVTVVAVRPGTEVNAGRPSIVPAAAAPHPSAPPGGTR